MKNETIYSELGQKTDIDITYSCAFKSGSFYVKSSKPFSGQGISRLEKFVSTLTKKTKYSFLATEKAFNKIKLTNDVCYEGIL